MELFESEIRKEAQAAHVNGQDRNPAWGSQTSSGKQSAVSPKHDQKLRCVRNALASLTFRTIQQTVGRFLVNEGLYAAGCKPFQQRGNDNGEIGAAWAGNDAYGLKGLSGMHVRLRFYPRDFFRAWRKYS